MSFTASHYLEVARIIRTRREALMTMREAREEPRYVHGARAELDEVTYQLGAMFARQNPKFNAGRFARDCTPKEG